MHSRASAQFRRRPGAPGPGHQGLLPRREPQVPRGRRNVAAYGVPEAGRQGTPHSLTLLSRAPDWRCSSRSKDPRAASRTRSGACLPSEGFPRRCLRRPSAILSRSLCCAPQGGGEELRKCTRVGMIAGGTGITPMLQIISAVLKDKGDKTEVLHAAALPRMQRLSMCASLHSLHLALAAVRQPDRRRHLVPQRACACAAPVNVLQLNGRAQELDALTAKHSNLKVCALCGRSHSGAVTHATGSAPGALYPGPPSRKLGVQHRLHLRRHGPEAPPTGGEWHTGARG